jgi:carboxymethylenebutenolidase
MNSQHIEDVEPLASRRRILQSALGIGYCVAAGPLMSQTAIRTSTEGLQVGEVMIDVNGYKMPVYRAQPAGKTNLPVVLVISEIFGVHEYIADVAVRFAKAGYLALAPELFGRQGDPSSYAEIAKLQQEVISKTPDNQVMQDLDACVSWAQSQGADTRRLAITGFCWGGRITWLYCMHQPKVKAGVAWYGRLEGKVTEQNPFHPIDRVDLLKAPVLGLYGEADTGISAESVLRMRAALAKATGNAAAQASHLVLYPQAPHAFHADYRESYRPGPAKDGWLQTLGWFEKQVLIK